MPGYQYLNRLVRVFPREDGNSCVIELRDPAVCPECEGACVDNYDYLCWRCDGEGSV